MIAYLNRAIRQKIEKLEKDFPAIAILGPRQCGKSTFAKKWAETKEKAVFLDLEKDEDIQKLSEPDIYFDKNADKIIFLDEVQNIPGLFRHLRSYIDQREKEGQFFLLGSASKELIKQSSESLAGRIVYVELTPFLFLEIDSEMDLYKYWNRGGFPRSYLATSDENSYIWREQFISTFLERDIPQLGFQIPAPIIKRLWTMCAHSHGQVLNATAFGKSLGKSHVSIRNYLEILSQTFVIRLLPPFENNLKKRLVKSPKVYLRDHGILNTLLNLEDYDDLLGHSTFGSSWEGLVIENILAIPKNWTYGFYRTANGAEIDLVLERKNKRIAIECKASKAPKLERGFHQAMEDLNIDEAFVVAPIEGHYPVKENVTVCSLKYAINKLNQL